MSTGTVLNHLSFLLTAARPLNQLIAFGPCGQRSPICRNCGAERKRKSGLVPHLSLLQVHLHHDFRQKHYQNISKSATLPATR